MRASLGTVVTTGASLRGGGSRPKRRTPGLSTLRAVPAHEITGEEQLVMVDGYGYVIRCACGEVFQEGPEPELSADGAKTAAKTAYGLHLHGA